MDRSSADKFTCVLEQFYNLFIQHHSLVVSSMSADRVFVGLETSFSFDLPATLDKVGG